MNKVPKFSDEALAFTQSRFPDAPLSDVVPRISRLVEQLIGRVADRWTMQILGILGEEGELRFTRLSERIPGISQKMLTQTLRQMQRDGLVERTVHAVVPPKVEYRLTALGMTLGDAFCGVWEWATENLEQVEAARRVFDAQPPSAGSAKRASSEPVR